MEEFVSEELKGAHAAFSPQAPGNLQNLDIPESLVEDLMLRRLYTVGVSTINSLCSALKLGFPVVQTMFQQLRQKQVLEITGMFNKSHYFGPAPVSVKRYDNGVRAQTHRLKLNRHQLKEALSDLVLTERFLDDLGPAIIPQTSLFLYGPTGNGKTSVAERLSRIYKDAVLIPYAVEFDGQIIVVYDPAVHERLDTHEEGLDPRWVVCRRPCITVGGELEPNMLELQLDESSGIYAAPLQMKANNGMLVIDDFGRQLISPKYLLNRWIVPLDRRVDYLTLRYGVKFQIPFEMIVVFATNLDPTELADEAFLRRIQNKVYVEPVNAQVFEEI
jgi:predicted ATPase with chaperone activity